MGTQGFFTITVAILIALTTPSCEGSAGAINGIDLPGTDLPEVVNGACYSKAEVDQMLADLKNQILAGIEHQCPDGMAQVGDFCVDRYEASIWVRKDGGAVDCGALQDAVDTAICAGWTDTDIYLGTHTTCGLTDSPLMCEYRQYGSPGGALCPSDGGEWKECDDYKELLDGSKEAWPDSGNWRKPLYACSIRGINPACPGETGGVYPSRSLTWFQASQACAASGKHLITNGEWQTAVAGTRDPGTETGNAVGDTRCNVKTTSARKTGLGSNGDAEYGEVGECTSQYGMEDMIGNLWEWVDMWGQAGLPTEGFTDGGVHRPWPADYAGVDENTSTAGVQTWDGTWNINGRAFHAGWKDGALFAALRDGGWNGGTAAGAFAFLATYEPANWSSQFGFRCAKGL